MHGLQITRKGDPLEHIVGSHGCYDLFVTVILQRSDGGIIRIEDVYSSNKGRDCCISPVCWLAAVVVMSFCVVGLQEAGMGQ